MTRHHRFHLFLPRQLILQGGRKVCREEFFEFLWTEFQSKGLIGVHEGTLLSETLTLDSAHAPAERDWINDQELSKAELYFENEVGAEGARNRLTEMAPGIQLGDLEEVPDQDWDAQWKASFKGILIPPDWQILPPWIESAQNESSLRTMMINPGAGFGTGTHETTQLCLRELTDEILSLKKFNPSISVLDFGSGSGILAIGAALLGAEVVDAVEIDSLAIENAMANAAGNSVENRIRFAQSLESLETSMRYDLIVANILKEVLLPFAPQLVSYLNPQGTLILSGLLASDLPEVIQRYSGLLLNRKLPRVQENGEWRSLTWVP